jgi:DNA repair protein RadD
MANKFELIFSRAGTDVMSELFGKNLLGLINALGDKADTQQSNRESLLKIFSPASILQNKKQRKILLELLKESEAEEILEALGVTYSGAAFDALINLNLRSSQLKIIFNFFQVQIPEIEVIEQSLDRELITPEYGLFEHQRNAISSVLEILEKSPHRVVLHMPTGAGKTRTAMNIVSQYLRVHEPAVVLWLANSEELCEQAATEFINSWRVTGNRNTNVQRYWGLHKELNLNDGVIVAGFQKIYSKFLESPTKFASFGEKVSMIIVDEAHQVIAPTYRAVVDAIQSRNPATSLVGLTATPGRTWDDIDSDKQLSHFFARKKVTLKVDGFDNPIEYLINEGYLARPKFEEIKFDSFTQSEVNDIYSDFEISDKLLKKLANDQLRTLRIVQKIESLAKRHKRILVFATTVEHSDTLAILLGMCGLAARSLSSKTPANERKGIIDWYKDDSDTLKILCNYGILTTGFDAPKTSAAIIARPTKSLVLFSQMVGRATRGIKAKGNKESEIVTVVDVELPGFRNISESFTNWEDIWE